MSNPEGLASRLDFRPIPIWDPVPWPYLVDILDNRQILEIAVVQVQLHRETMLAHVRATEAIEKVLAAKG